MTKVYVIGRCGISSISIPVEKDSVSGEHVKITVSDEGSWELEDLDSANGTYVKDENGDFQRVYKKVIDPHTIIRLGREGHNSYVFMAHRVEAEDDSYNFEFRYLKKLLKRQLEEEEQLENRNARNMKIVKCASPLAMVLCIVAQYIVPGLKNDANLNLWISRGAMALAPVAVGLFFGIDARSVKALRQKRQKLLTCPKCGFPVSEFDINNMQCSRCKAK